MHLALEVSNGGCKIDLVFDYEASIGIAPG